MAKGRFTFAGKVSFFMIKISARENEIIVNVKIEAPLLKIYHLFIDYVRQFRRFSFNSS